MICVSSSRSWPNFLFNVCISPRYRTLLPSKPGPIPSFFSQAVKNPKFEPFWPWHSVLEGLRSKKTKRITTHGVQAANQNVTGNTNPSQRDKPQIVQNTQDINGYGMKQEPGSTPNSAPQLRKKKTSWVPLGPQKKMKPKKTKSKSDRNLSP